MFKYSCVSYDWKQGGAEEEYEEALKEFGLVMTEDPVCEGSDTYSYFITDFKPTEAQIKEMIIDLYGEDILAEE